MQPKSYNEAGLFRNLRLILLSFIILIVFLIWAKMPWILLVIVLLIVLTFSNLLFWQQYAVPDLGIAEQILLTKSILINQFTRSPLMLSIKNGEIDGDYLLLKNKPEIKVLKIDHKSAVLIKDASNQRSIMFDGVHILSKNSKIIGIFYLGIRCLKIGPRERSDLDTKLSTESLAEYHLRKQTAERTKSRLFSGDYIYPSFSIFYTIYPSSEEKLDIMRYQSICEKIGGSGPEMVSPERIDAFIVIQLLEKWNAYCENKNLDEVLTVLPDSFEIFSLNEIGIRSIITLDQIFC